MRNEIMWAQTVYMLDKKYNTNNGNNNNDDNMILIGATYIRASKLSSHAS